MKARQETQMHADKWAQALIFFEISQLKWFKQIE